MKEDLMLFLPHEGRTLPTTASLGSVCAGGDCQASSGRCAQGEDRRIDGSTQAWRQDINTGFCITKLPKASAYTKAPLSNPLWWSAAGRGRGAAARRNIALEGCSPSSPREEGWELSNGRDSRASVAQACTAAPEDMELGLS
ncbi:unnamed protein product [Gadus morhua 'NCC']